MEKTLNITGKGVYVVAPTQTVIIIKFDNVLPTYKEALSLSVKDSKEIKEVFKELGFKKADLKTINFDIRTKYKDTYDGHSNRIETFVGYQYNQQFKIKFKNDNTLLSKILAKLSNCISNPKFSISYEIENKEAAKEEALKLAVEDATAKANIIAKASNVTLSNIININYSDSKNNYDLTFYDSCDMFNCKSMEYDEDEFDVDFNPDDLSLKETVNITWEIK